MNVVLRQRLRFARPLVRAARRALRTVVRITQRPLGTMIEGYPRRFLPNWLLIPLAHEATDVVTLETMVKRAAADLDRGRHSRGLHILLVVALRRRGRLALDAHDDATALESFERLHGLRGPTADTWTWQAVALRRLGRLDASFDAGEAALEIDPDWCPALVHLGMLNIQMGRSSLAVEYLRQVLELPHVPPDQLEWVWRGLDRVGEHQLASAVADRLSELRDGDAWADAYRAVSMRRLGLIEGAEELLRSIQLGSTLDHIHACAFVLGSTGQASDAWAILQKVPPKHRRRELVRDVVRGLQDEGHLRAALALCDESVASSPADTGFAETRRLVAGTLRVFEGQWLVDQLPVVGRRPAARYVERCDVLHIVGRTVPYASSGYAVRTDYTVRAQRELGMDARVVSQLGFPWSEGHKSQRVEDVGGVPHYRLPSPPSLRRPAALDAQMSANVDELSELVERIRPGVLHAASDFRNGLIALVVGERLGIPVVYEMRGFWEETWLSRRHPTAIDSDVYRLRRAREDDIAHRSAQVVTLAPAMRDALIERGIATEKISLAPNAVDPAMFPERPRDDRLATQVGIGRGELVVGYISSFVPYEGIDVLIDGIARVRDRGVVAKGLLVGDGPMRSQLERQVRELALEANVIFTGRVPHDQIAAYYSIIDVFVVPRTNASVCRLVSPLKPFEAMAARRAMIVSGTPVLREIVGNGRYGRVFEPENAEDLAVQIALLAADSRAREVLGDDARSHVLAHHTWSRNAERYRQVYKGIGETWT